MKIFTLLLPLALRLISKYMDKNEHDHKLKDSWMNFIWEMNHYENSSTKINESINEIIAKQYNKDMKNNRPRE